MSEQENGTIVELFEGPTETVVEGPTETGARHAHRRRSRGHSGATRLEAMLAAHPVFGHLDEGLRAEAARLFRTEDHVAGEVVFAPGDGAQEFYLVLGGEVEIRAPGAPASRREPGDGFGELGLLPGQVRRARVRAGSEGARCASLHRLALGRLLEEEPDRARSFHAALEERVRPLGIDLKEPRDRSTMAGSPRLFALAAARDGVGRSTLAVNLATSLAIDGLETAVVDLDPGGGDVALLTDVDPVRSWTDLFGSGEGEDGFARLEPAQLREALLPAGGGLFVLPAPPRSEWARRPTPGDVQELLQSLGRAFDAVVVDCPAGTGPLAEIILRKVDVGLVVGSYTVQGIFALNRMLASLGRQGLHYGRLQVVLNRLGRMDDAPLEEREALMVPAITRILEDLEVGRAAGHGRPDVLLRPGGTMALACKRLRKRLDLVRRRRGSPRRPAEERARARSLVALGRSLFLEGRHTEARGHLEEAVPALSDDSEAAVLLGRIYEDAGESRRGAECFKAAMEVDREDLHALCRAAASTENEILIQSGLKRLARAVARFPERADYHLLEGLLHQARSRPVEADACFAQALDFNPSYAEAMRRRGDVAMGQGDLPRAVVRYREATELYPVEPRAHLGLVRAYDQLNLVGPALEAVQRLLHLVPGEPEARRREPQLRAALATVDEEIRTYSRALAANPDFPDVLLLRAGALARRGRAQAASEDARRALARGASLPGARLLLRLVRVLLAPARARTGSTQAA